jgi:hypothetical protein
MAFWRATVIGAGVTVVLMSGINGELLDTGFGNVLKFIIGALFGLVAVSVFAMVDWPRAALGCHPTPAYSEETAYRLFRRPG